MKQVLHSADKTEIYAANLLLAGKGIPSFIGNASSGPALGFLYADKYTLWICLEFQYEDAVAVLENPDHEVQEPVDQVDFQNYIDSSMKDINGLLLGKLKWPILALLCVSASVLIYSHIG